jgi:hypothetical protein
MSDGGSVVALVRGSVVALVRGSVVALVLGWAVERVLVLVVVPPSAWVPAALAWVPAALAWVTAALAWWVVWDPCSSTYPSANHGYKCWDRWGC